MSEFIKKREDLQGLEFDYLVSDKLERIARISSAGYGSISELALQNDDWFDKLDNHLSDFPKIAKCRIEVEISKSVSEWIDTVERGIFIYTLSLKNFPKAFLEKIELWSHCDFAQDSTISASR